MMKLSNRIITIDRTPVYFGNDSLSCIDGMINTLRPDGIFILVDLNTRKHCLPLLLNKTTSFINAQVIEFEGGEAAKSIENAGRIWNELLMSGAGRSSLLINLGGGVVSDLGGFVAAGYQRGIRYINIPTSLMGQCDAAIGGKTSVNLGHIKNQVGFFHAAQGVFIFPGFLNTLPEDHLRSGLAEIIKSALIGDAALWRRLIRHPVRVLLQQPVERGPWLKLMAGAVTYKNRVVMRDYRERKLRKVLNFGHTIGHALEGFSHMGSKKPLLHGEAVAAGMICASFLSHRKAGLALSDLEAITAFVADGFPAYPVDISAIPALMEFMMHDKKKHGGHLLFTLISKPGHPLINVPCDMEEITEAIRFYTTIQ
jgi:3-dehydroquinate synthase